MDRQLCVAFSETPVNDRGLKTESVRVPRITALTQPSLHD
jgi:hypothetical protein